MSTIKATPGPWRLECSCTVVSDGPFVNRRCSPCLICHTDADSHDGESEANARLIAAAPELRDALRGMIELCDGTCPAPGRTNVAENARALIARLDAEDK